jgi:predicted MFS family arabinose efflux permease
LALISVLGSLPAVFLAYRQPRVTPSGQAKSSIGEPDLSKTSASSTRVLLGLIGFLLIGASLVANLPLVLSQMQTPLRDVAWILSLFGIGQLAARALDYVAAKWLSTRATVVASSSSIVLAMALMAWTDSQTLAAAVFVLLLGAGNGLVTILRGVLPTQLFHDEAFAKLSGQLARYGAVSRALMPMVAAQALSLRGGLGLLSLTYGLLALFCGWLLWQQLKTD